MSSRIDSLRGLSSTVALPLEPKAKGNRTSTTSALLNEGELSALARFSPGRTKKSPLKVSLAPKDPHLLADGTGNPTMKLKLAEACEVLRQNGGDWLEAKRKTGLSLGELGRYIDERVGDYQLSLAGNDAVAGMKATVTPDLLRHAKALLDAPRIAPLSLRTIAAKLAIPHNTIGPWLEQVTRSDGRKQWQLGKRAMAEMNDAPPTYEEATDFREQ
ncbi:hypothetical protein [Paraburkholderia youngii]|uniref:hypothetical protein n=1 Tax=Paraburkholderia youngii TaxID=2782701 RepID=UPI003D201FF6